MAARPDYDGARVVIHTIVFGGRMDGVVVFVSRNQGILVVQSGYGFTVVEMLGREGDLQVQNAVRGNWSSDGGGVIQNEHGEKFSVYLQGSYAFAAPAIAMARSIGGG